jgi:RND family efflux transporter MFP subunit
MIFINYNKFNMLHFTCCISLLCLSLSFTSCTSKNGKAPQVAPSYTDNVKDEPTIVKAIPLKYNDFTHELLSNGTVASVSKADLKFQVNEVVAHIYVKNGDKVSKGQVIAELERFKLQNSLNQAKDNLLRARLDLQDVLIGQGYTPSDSSGIPHEVMQMAKVKSGYDQNLNSYQLAAYNLDATTLRAPFDGVLANLFAKPYNYPSAQDAFCTIIDNQHFEVIFNILESELPMLRVGDKALVSTFAAEEKAVTGKIVEINPAVSAKGLVRAKADISNDGQFYEGMNVKVRVQRQPEKQLVIPKTALLLRDGKKVVFTLKNGLAHWNYVQTSHENTDSYVVTEGLAEGDSVIYEGNLNLAHEAPALIQTNEP